MASPAFDMASLILRARRRADMEFSDFIGSGTLGDGSEDETIVEKSWQEFYLKVVGEYDDMCVSQSPNPQALGPATNSTLEMPSNFLKLKGILLQDTTGAQTLSILRPITGFREIEPFVLGGPYDGRPGRPTHYWLHGLQDGAPAHARVYPFPDTDYQAQIWFVPNLSLADVTGFDGLRWLAGWDEYVVITAAMKMKDKEESDCTLLLAERTALWDSMKRCLTPMDASEPTHVVSMPTGGYRRMFNEDPFASEQFG